MNLVHKIETWGDTHHPVVLDPVRIALGIFLAFKGASFLENTYTIHSMIANQSSVSLPDSLLMSIVYLVAFVNLIGGMFIALGVVTRTASLILIPILLGAVILSQSQQIQVNNDLWFSSIALCLLVIFSVVGAGKLSIQKILEDQNLII